MEEYKIRPFTEDNWLEFKEIRLEALANHPNFFSPSKDETKFIENDWKERICNPKNCIFGLYFQNKIIGLTGIFIDKANIEIARIYGWTC